MKADLPTDIAASIDLSGLDDLEGISPDLRDAAIDAAVIVATDGGYESQLFNQLNTRANNFAKTRGSQLVSDITDSTRDDLRVIIGSGLDSGLTKDGIADLIQSQDPYLFSADRADLIASTEIANANGQGALESYKEIKALGVNIMKQWLPDDDPCPECQANADQGPIDVEDDFDSGDDSSPAHPNCFCTTISVYPKEGE